MTRNVHDGAATPRVRRWPADRFFWAILEPGRLGASGRRLGAEQMGYLFEQVLPLPIESVQHRGHALRDGRVIVCGVPHAALDEAARAGALEGAVILCPEGVPAFIAQAAGEEVAPEEFNVLTGRHEAPIVRRWRRRCAGVVLFGAILLLTLVVAGTIRREAAAQHAIANLEAERVRLIEDAIPAAGADALLPADLRLTAALRRLEQSRGDPGPAVAEATEDASRLLAGVLSHWPADANAAVDSLVVTGTAVDVRGSAPGAASAAQVATGLRNLAGWRVPQPQFRAAREGVTFSLRLERDEAAAGAEGGAE